MSVTEKFKPEALEVSGKMTAILGFLLDEEWTEPQIVEMHITSDGHVLARNEGEVGANNYIGVVGDLKRNIRGVCEAVGLTRDERREFAQAARSANIALDDAILPD